MSDGTAARGRNSSKKSHIICRRCHKHSYHVNKKRCSSCGYGKSSKLRSYNWQKK